MERRICKAEHSGANISASRTSSRFWSSVEGLGSSLGSKADKELQDAPRKPLCLGLSMRDCPLLRSPCLIAWAELNLMCSSSIRAADGCRCTLLRRIDDLEARMAAQRVKVDAHEAGHGTSAPSYIGVVSSGATARTLQWQLGRRASELSRNAWRPIQLGKITRGAALKVHPPCLSLPFHRAYLHKVVDVCRFVASFLREMGCSQVRQLLGQEI